MGQAKAGKRAVVISSDEESDTLEAVLTDKATDGADVSGGKRKTGNTVNGRSATRPKQAPTKIAKAPSPSNSASSQSQRAKAPPTAAAKKSKGTIYSFFNAATQNQQAPRRSTGPQRPSDSNLSQDILDTIDGGDDDIPITHGSRTAVAQRKRKLKHNEEYGSADTSSAPLGTQKFRKTIDGSKIPSRPVIEDRRPWTDQYAPLDLSELAVHKKKVTDVRNLLTEGMSPRARPRLIILKGAAGNGKTTTVRLLAKDMGVEILEWKNPSSADAGSEAFVSASAQFEEFILRSGRFVGLDLVPDLYTAVKTSMSEPEVSGSAQADRPQMILIEEFPNTFAKSSNILQAFRSTVQQFLSAPVSAGQKPVPIVMIISETLLSTSTAAADSFTAHRLLGPAILTHPYIAELEFNAVATTFLTKALELIVTKEARKSGRRRTPGPGVLKHLAETGDIRSAVSSLEFLCLRGDSDDTETWGSKVAFTKPKKAASKDAPLTKQEEEALKLIGNRASSLGIFHSVGKVVYNKRMDPPPPPQHKGSHGESLQMDDEADTQSHPTFQLPQHRRVKIPETDADALLTELGTDTSTFVAALHENYALSCSSTIPEEMLDNLNGCMDALSDADMLVPDRFSSGSRNFSGSAQDSLRQDEFAFQTAVRGLLFALPYPVKRGASAGSGASRGRSDAFRMFYPTSLKIWKRKEAMEGLAEMVMTSYSSALGSATYEQQTKKREGGVESWKRNQQLTTQVADSTIPTEDGGPGSDDQASPPSLLTSQSAKTENLLERLPYLSQILSHRKTLSSSATFTEHVRKLTSFDGLGLPTADDENGDGDADVQADQDPAGASEWTDRPDVEDGNDNSSGKRTGRGGAQKEKTAFGAKSGTRGKGRTETEGGGLHIPVEHEVERLVLSDDDIVD